MPYQNKWCYMYITSCDRGKMLLNALVCCKTGACDDKMMKYEFTTILDNQKISSQVKQFFLLNCLKTEIFFFCLSFCLSSKCLDKSFHFMLKDFAKIEILAIRWPIAAANFEKQYFFMISVFIFVFWQVKAQRKLGRRSRFV